MSLRDGEPEQRIGARATRDNGGGWLVKTLAGLSERQRGGLRWRVRAIRRSGLFDSGWYALEHELANNDELLILHYLAHYRQNSVSPHPLFDVKWYRSSVPESELSGCTELEHYLRKGRRQGLIPTPLFDRAWYRRQVAASQGRRQDEFHHFLHVGAAQGLSPHPLFDPQHYASQDRKLDGLRFNALTHYTVFGGRSGKDPNVMFDSRWYLKSYGHLVGAITTPLSHFIAEGAELGLSPHPAIDLKQIRTWGDFEGCSELQIFTDLVLGQADPDIQRRVLAKVREHEIARRAERAGVRTMAAVPDVDWSELCGQALDEDLVPAIPLRSERCEIALPDDDVELVTLGLWDTVLRRNCHPDEIKLQSARYLYLVASDDLRPLFRDIAALLKSRLSCENASAENDEFEYRLEDAVDRWLAQVLVPGVHQTKVAAYRAALLDHEFEAELAATRLDPIAAEYLASLRRPAVFVSDFYASADFLTRLLEAHGVPGRLIKGYASSDTFETKRSGALFDKVVVEAGVEPGRIMHLGDNPRADVEMATAKGLRVHHCIDAGEEARRDWFGIAYAALMHGDRTVHQRRIKAMCEQVARGLADEEDGSEDAEMRRLGARIAPLAVSFILSILEQAIRYEMPVVHYFTREGIFLQQVHDAVAAADPYGIAYPSSEVLHVSRRATFAASLDEVTAQELMNVWRLYSTQSLCGLAHTLNLEEGKVRSLATEAGIDPEERLEEPWRHRAVMEFLAQPAFRSLARAHVAEQREGLLRYLGSKGVLDEASLMIVDIGWRGSIQDNLARLLPQTRFSGHYLGLYSFLNPQAPNSVKRAWIFDEPRGASARIGDVAPLEMIFNGPGGSVTGYEVGDEGVSAKHEVVAGEESIVVGPVAALQAGVLAAVPQLVKYIRLHGLTSEDLKDLAVQYAAALTMTPPSVLASVFQRLQHNEMFGRGLIDDIGANSELADVLDKFTGSELHAAATRALEQERWPEGAVRDSRIVSWWGKAAWNQRGSLPLEISAVYLPAIVKARGAKLAIFAPAPLRASGGHRTIFNMIRRLERLGFQAEIFLEGAGAGLAVAEEYLGDTPATLHRTWRGFETSDVAFATIAHSAELVAGLSDAHFKGYLVQDFESLFNPMSDGYINGENSFGLGLQHFTIGNWLTHVIQHQFAGAAVPAGLGADTQIYRPLAATANASFDKLRDAGTASGRSKEMGASGEQDDRRREDAVCFLYQPDKPRRLPELGIEALRTVKRDRPDCTIYVYGSELPLVLDFEVENLGLIQDLEALNELYNRCTVGLCISGSNPSRIPYEMMAAGCVPVDLYRYNNLLDHRAGTILLSYQNADSIAKAVLSLLNDPAQARRMSQEGTAFAGSRTLDWEMDVIANGVLAMIDGSLPAKTSLDLLYDAAPVIAGAAHTRHMQQFCASQLQMAYSSR